MGKSLISYVVGHAVCKGYIDNVNVKLNDWIVLNDTLYADNTLLQVLNMTSGDQDYIGEKKFKGDGYFNGDKNKQINRRTVAESMLWFKGTKRRKKTLPIITVQCQLMLQSTMRYTKLVKIMRNY